MICRKVASIPQSVREIVARDVLGSSRCRGFRRTPGSCRTSRLSVPCARTAGVPYVVDACQAVGQIPIDVARLRCDYLSATARKFMRGPARHRVHVRVRPRARARRSSAVRRHAWRALGGGRCVRGGTRPRGDTRTGSFRTRSCSGRRPRHGMRSTSGLRRRRSRAWVLAARLRDALGDIAGVRVLDRGSTRCAIVTMTAEGRHADTIVRALKERRINTVSSLAGVRDLRFRCEGSGRRPCVCRRTTTTPKPRSTRPCRR